MSSVLVPRSLAVIFSSDPTVGAENVSADGSSFSITMNSPIAIPKNAMNCDVAVVSAQIYNTSPNVAAAFANNVFQYTTSQAPAGTFTINIPDGLYSLEALGQYISTQTSNTGHSPGLFVFSADNASQKAIITFEVAGDSINFGVANSCASVLGFNPIVYTAPSNGYNLFAPNVAAFNRNSSYIIATNLITGGIPLNANGRGIIANIPINVPPGSLIAYEPSQLTWCDASELIGASRRNMTFRLLNQALLSTPTTGETWQVVVMIKYDVLYTSGDVPMRPAR